MEGKAFPPRTVTTQEKNAKGVTENETHHFTGSSTVTESGEEHPWCLPSSGERILALKASLSRHSLITGSGHFSNGETPPYPRDQEVHINRHRAGGITFLQRPCHWVGSLATAGRLKRIP